MSRDYEAFLREIGISDTVALMLSRDMSDHVDCKGWYYIADSEIHGKGAFAKEGLRPRELVGYMRIDGKRTMLRRTTNHSDQPNTLAMRMGNSDLIMLTRTAVNHGEELTLNYRQVLSVNKELSL